MSVKGIMNFTPYAWAKILYLRDLGKTEVGGFLEHRKENPSLAVDFHLVQQECEFAWCELTDDGIAEYTNHMVDRGLQFSEFMRIWLHTHPGCGPNPSTQDENTFSDTLGNMEWAGMFIVDKSGETYGRIRYNGQEDHELHEIRGCKDEFLVDFLVDCSQEFQGSDHTSWDEEYHRNVTRLHRKRLGLPGNMVTVPGYGIPDLYRTQKRMDYDYDPTEEMDEQQMEQDIREIQTDEEFPFGDTTDDLDTEESGMSEIVDWWNQLGRPKHTEESLVVDEAEGSSGESQSSGSREEDCGHDGAKVKKKK